MDRVVGRAEAGDSLPRECLATGGLTAEPLCRRCHDTGFDCSCAAADRLEKDAELW